MKSSQKEYSSTIGCSEDFHVLAKTRRKLKASGAKAIEQQQPLHPHSSSRVCQLSVEYLLPIRTMSSYFQQAETKVESAFQRGAAKVESTAYATNMR